MHRWQIILSRRILVLISVVEQKSRQCACSLWKWEGFFSNRVIAFGFLKWTRVFKESHIIIMERFDSNEKKYCWKPICSMHKSNGHRQNAPKKSSTFNGKNDRVEHMRRTAESHNCMGKNALCYLCAFSIFLRSPQTGYGQKYWYQSEKVWCVLDCVSKT